MIKMGALKYFLACYLTSWAIFKVGSTEIETGVVWSPSDQKVINSALLGTIDFELINPCTVLAPKFHHDLQELVLRHCHLLYKEVLQDLQEWCPRTDLSRNRRVIIEIAGLIAFATIFAVGFIVDNAKTQVDELQGRSKAMERFTADIENQIKNFDERFNNLTEHYNLLASKVQMFNNDYQTLKASSVASTFETTWFINKLQAAQVTIREAKRLWNNGEFSMSLLDIFEMQLPCSNDECPHDLIKPHSCSFSGGNTAGLSSNISLIINIPKIDPDVVAMRAHAFDLVVSREDKMCVAEYNGPRTMFMSKSKNCQLAGRDLDLHGNRLGYLSLYHENTCLPPSGIQNYYNISKCFPHDEFNVTDYVQVKFLNNEVYLYCPGGTFKVKGTNRECSDDIMVLPFTNDISVNGIAIVGSHNLTKRVDFASQLHTVAVYQLPMHLNFTDSEFHDKDTFKELKFSDYQWPVVATTGFSMITIAVILIVVFCVLRIFKKIFC